VSFLFACVKDNKQCVWQVVPDFFGFDLKKTAGAGLMPGKKTD
jgi:hypothetical protein